MKAGGGKQKGASFEREVCVMLSKWVTDGRREDVFWRSAMSGGRATVGHRRGKSHAAQVGDISCIHPDGQSFINVFAPECKFYASLDYQGLLTGKGKLLAFWTEINEQASRYKKRPFLIARQNRLPTYICIDWLGMEELKLSEQSTTLISIPHNMYLIEVNNFLKWCKPYVVNDRRPPSNRPRKRSRPLQDL